MTEQKYRRRRKLIRPGLQLRLTLTFFSVALFALALQAALFASSLGELASELPVDGPLVLESSAPIILWVAAISVLLLLPLCGSIGILATFRVAGPLYRMEQHLEQIAQGGDPGVCTIRRDDELQDFCATLNRALTNLRGRAANVEAVATIVSSSPQPEPPRPLPASDPAVQTDSPSAVEA